jgi:hypothetical protein
LSCVGEVGAKTLMDVIKKQEVRALLREYRNIFMVEGDVPGWTGKVKHMIDTGRSLLPVA